MCPKCDQVFKKEFPIDLEGQIIGFKCPCAILPVRPIYHTRKLKIEKNLNSISLTSNKKVIKNSRIYIEATFVLQQLEWNG